MVFFIWHSIKKIIEEGILTPILTLLQKYKPVSYAHRFKKYFSHEESCWQEKVQRIFCQKSMPLKF